MGCRAPQGTHRHAARAGHHLSPQPLSSGENIFAATGPGLTLLALDQPERTVAEFANAAARLNLPMTIVQDRYTDARLQYEAKLLLIRPDHYVAWAAQEADPAQIERILAKVIGR